MVLAVLAAAVPEEVTLGAIGVLLLIASVLSIVAAIVFVSRLIFDIELSGKKQVKELSI